MPAPPRPLPPVERWAGVRAGRARGIGWALCLLLAAALPGGGQPAPENLTVISRDGRRTLPTVDVGGRTMVALPELMGPFGLRLGEDRQPGQLTLVRGPAVMVLTAGDGIVSVAGRLESLSSPPVERGGVWYVPTDFIGRALPLISDQPVELRSRSGLVIVGDVRVPQVVGRYQRIGRRSRLRLMVTPNIEPRIERAAGQLLVTFEADAVDLVMRDFAPDDLLRRVTVDDRRARLEAELGGGFGSFAANSSPALGGSLEVVIDLGPAAEARAAPPPAPAPRATVETEVGFEEEGAELPALADFAEPSTVSAIAIDAGHGGTDVGTLGPEGTLEKDVTLGVARRLQAAIQRRLGLRVVLTRSGDVGVTLDERAAIANNNLADLFISLHANASMRETATGAEVFHLSPVEDDDPGGAQTAGEWVPDVNGGTRRLDIVRWERAQLRFVDRSAIWARTLAEELRGRVPMSPRGVQQAPLRVLVGANMPAALVEMGFISNPGQEVQLASPEFQDAFVDAVIESIIRFRDLVEQGFPEDDAPAEDPPADGSAPLREPLP